MPYPSTACGKIENCVDLRGSHALVGRGGGCSFGMNGFLDVCFALKTTFFVKKYSTASNLLCFMYVSSEVIVLTYRG